MRRPAVFLVRRQPFGPRGFTYTRWMCTSALKTAKFQSRRRASVTAILHRSTKYPGKWQLTRFEDETPTSDIQTSTCVEALREVPPAAWRLRRLVPPGKS